LFTDDKVLVMGGMGVDTNPNDSFMMIDLDENKWKGLKPMPTARYATFSFIINDKLYVIGKLLCVFCKDHQNKNAISMLQTNSYHIQPCFHFHIKKFSHLFHYEYSVFLLKNIKFNKINIHKFYQCFQNSLF
jgi:hypothetical protein